ncbi:MAG: SH3 domain-containing protein [Chloroflexi bacterium]|nr:SH3 domain-containing protein [Chloroflexota bacterium]
MPANEQLPSTSQPEFGAATFTPTPTPTRFQPTVAVRQELIVAEIPPPVFAPADISAAGASVYQYDVEYGQPFDYQGLQLRGGVVLFSPNPAAPGSYLRTDQVGMLWYRPLGATNEGAMSYSPFHEGYGVPSSDVNKNRVVEIDWSADGTQFSFRIDPPSGQDTVNAGVWFWQPLRETPTDPTYPVIRDCVTDGYLSCQLVNRSNAGNWKTIDVAWSPIPGRSDILLTLELTAEGRQALAVVQALRDADYAQRAPEFFRYDYGHWNTDGSGIVVSGRRADGRVIIGQVNSDLRGEQLVFDASSVGLWVQDAVRRPNGQIVALGRPGGPYDNAPVSLYNSGGARLSGPIGDAAPESVRWYSDRSAVVVTVHGRQYTLSVDSGLITDSADLARNPAFGTGNVGVAPVPDAVIQNSEYFPGQQLRTVQNLNLRQGPSTSHAIIAGLYAGDYVAILAGPYDNQGYRWWRVQSASNALGWIAGSIDGRPTIRP